MGHSSLDKAISAAIEDWLDSLAKTDSILPHQIYCHGKLDDLKVKLSDQLSPFADAKGDLLEACRVALHEQYSRTALDEETVTVLEAAISKAEGR